MTATDLETQRLSGTLEDLDVWHHIQRESEVEILRVVATFLAEHDESTVDAARAELPGRERAVTLGGAGTPKVAEFAPALVAGRLELSSWAATRLCADVLDLRHRLHNLWGRVLRFEARAGHARFVARRTRDLPVDQAAAVDARVAESADGRLSWSRFESLVEAAIIDADPEAARRREEEAETEQFARASRSNEHGMRGFYVKAPFPVITRLDATVQWLADALEALGDTDPLDARRVKAVLILANPQQAVALLKAYAAHRGSTGSTGSTNGAVDESKLLPKVLLYVHLSDQPKGTARVEGEPPIGAEWVRRWLGPRCSFRITPVLDPLTQTPVDAWEIPDVHREAVHLLSPADTFPFSANTTRNQQIDHTAPYRPNGPPGQSAIGNYGPMTTFHHRLKTHGGWQVRQPFPGIYVWRDPGGATYLVDHTGTRRLQPDADAMPS